MQEGDGPQDSDAAQVRGAKELMEQPTRARLRRAGMIYCKQGHERCEEGELEPWLRWNTVWSAASNGDAVLLKRLLESEASLVNLCNAASQTALHLACERGHGVCVLLLLEMGAQSCVDARGKTPVQLAAENCHTDIVKHLCWNNHLGTDSEACQQLLAIASRRNDKRTLAVLERHLNPAMGGSVAPDQLRRQQTLAARRAREEAEARTSEEVRRAAVLVPPPPLEPLGEPETWTAQDVERWLSATIPGAKEALFLRAFSRYHITGEVLLCLTSGELVELFQRLGMPTPFRTQAVQAFTSLGYSPERFDFMQARKLPVAVGNGVAFRVIGFVKAAMSTPLQTCRRFVTANAVLTQPTPDPFVFASTRDGQHVPNAREGERLVSNLGFIVLLQPTPSSPAPDD